MLVCWTASRARYIEIVRGGEDGESGSVAVQVLGAWGDGTAVR